jgi:hypothetical protein
MRLVNRLTVTRLFALLIGLTLTALLPQQAKAIPVLAGETLRVEFGFSAPPEIGVPIPPDHPFRVATVLFGFLNATHIGGPGAPSADIALYDGDALLGSYSLSFSAPFTTFAFSAPGGLYTFRAGQASDFASIIDGTIDGVLLITNTSTVAFDLSVSNLVAGHGSGPNQLSWFSPNPVINYQGVTAIAEPASLAAMLSGLLIFGAGARRV